MYKRIISGIATLAIIAVAAWNVNINTQKSNNLADILLANQEQLAMAEDLPEVTITCNSSCSGIGQCWTRVGTDTIYDYWGVPIIITLCEFTGSMSNNCTCGTHYTPLTGY
jgi:hypothetical protein